MTADALYTALMNEAGDYEATLLEDLAMRIGFRWRCECGWANPAADPACGGCAADQP